MNLRPVSVAAALVALLGAGLVATATHNADAGPKSLASAVRDHGLAAGEPLWVPPGQQKVKAVDPKDRASERAGGTPQGSALPTTRMTEEEALDRARTQVAARTAGCVPEYGAGQGCLPVASPGQVRHDQQMGPMPGMTIPWTCPELRVLVPAGLALSSPGVDPQHLDINGDGLACGTGD